MSRPTIFHTFFLIFIENAVRFWLLSHQHLCIILCLYYTKHTLLLLCFSSSLVSFSFRLSISLLFYTFITHSDDIFLNFIAASCKHVQCPIGQHCLEDQNLMPHCVTCSITCPPYDPAVKSVIPNPARLVCGVDGNTYRNLCEIKRSACMLGRSIPVAYRGACKGEFA